jgi:hypothetical protein
MADPFRGGFKVLITGAQGFQRSAVFATDAPWRSTKILQRDAGNVKRPEATKTRHPAVRKLGGGREPNSRCRMADR